ncbi:hypothetical protein JZK57_00085 [Staphylococcus aureus]|uniref:hypothetical protein n=1 Tax=Staphylococcus aureus TaxID=1280 RepID=UPI000A5A5647|nr:hypothetical protein [Staphylococcus aureus]MCB8271246.1 hypothetical protein [Staphylococcus aureus]MCC5344568.1 hypothetical protein [Staphylococcus aureus]MDT3276249.1 hypothetical protein [Staphylococcus aureus]BDV04076.1 hypothetical protein JP008_00350 [Staphylococcus aureus]HBC9199437.1 hypothetical protein [Staphylococcus aureus]
MKYDGIQQDEYLLNSNMLGAKTSNELKRLRKVAFLIAESFVEEEGYKFYFRIV